MKRVGFILGFFMLALMCFGQQGIVYDEVLVKAPRYAGDMDNVTVKNPNLAPIEQYLFSRLQAMVDEDNNIFTEGTVIVDFTVMADGSIKDVKVQNSVDYNNDNAVVNGILATDGDWQPGSKNGEAVEMKKRVVIAFDNPDTPTLRQKSIAYYHAGIKKYFKGEDVQSDATKSAEKAVKVSTRKYKGALKRFDMANRFTPENTSIVFMQVKTCEKIGDYDRLYDYEQKLNKLLSFGGMRINYVAIAL